MTLDDRSVFTDIKTLNPGSQLQPVQAPYLSNRDMRKEGRRE